MTPSSVIRAAVAILVALFVAPDVSRADAPDSTRAPVAVALGPGSTLWLEGTSTMHAFESRSSEVALGLERDRATADPASAAEILRLIRSAAVRGVTVRVPVATLRSEKSGLDKNLRKTMKADQYPDVSFRLDRYELAAGAANADTITIEASGSLVIAGVERPIRLEARAYPGEAGIWLEGSEGLRMSEYGIKPPTMMLGTVKVADRIEVHYRMLLVPRSEGSSAASSRTN